MPFFNYYCTQCHQTTEILQRQGESNATDCPACRAPRLVKKITVPYIRFAGSGYYETDDKPKDKQRNVVREDTGTKA